MLKTIRIIDDVINKLIRIIMIVILLIGVWFLYDTIYVFYHANDTSMLQYKPDSLNQEVLKDLSDEAIGWITVDDTNIDYPIMQGKTNDIYLNKDPYGSFSLAGSIFLDSRNDPEFRDPYSLVYGHHMEHELMFGALDRFQNKEYLQAHNEGTIYTLTGKIYALRIFAASQTQTSNDYVFAVTENEGPAQWIENNADVYIDPGNDTWKEHIVGLSTCKTPDSIDRTLVFGWIEETTGTLPEGLK